MGQCPSADLRSNGAGVGVGGVKGRHRRIKGSSGVLQEPLSKLTLLGNKDGITAAPGWSGLQAVIPRSICTMQIEKIDLAEHGPVITGVEFVGQECATEDGGLPALGQRMDDAQPIAFYLLPINAVNAVGLEDGSLRQTAV
jgi:hypothetical protein